MKKHNLSKYICIAILIFLTIGALIGFTVSDGVWRTIWLFVFVIDFSGLGYCIFAPDHLWDK